MVKQAEAIAAVDEAFGLLSKPDHFTNYTHCPECADHDELLRNRTRDTLTFQDVGNPGWEPMCFSSAEGVAFYMPSLARLAFAEPPYGYDWYGLQLLFHLYNGGLENKLYTHCNLAQRAAVATLISAMIEFNPEEIELTDNQDEFLRAYQIWAHGKA
ncbi:hypothetical protein [Dyella sp. C11]|uniref:hypothetical protein n=1 Tax=Dyella sp. C11 TaxID=2126991 RepID=UPI000D658D66|nr:hypothetical protein [Dyella sp. C11]